MERMPNIPIVAFVNPSSGAGSARALEKDLQLHLGASQVFNLRESDPEVVLRGLADKFDKLIEEGDLVAQEVRKKLVILIAGGDGSVSWVLHCVRKIFLVNPPPVLPVPLGTGNDLARSMGWKTGISHINLEGVMERIAESHAIFVDGWKVTLTGTDFLPEPGSPMSPEPQRMDFEMHDHATSLDGVNMELDTMPLSPSPTSTSGPSKGGSRAMSDQTAYPNTLKVHTEDSRTIVAGYFSNYLSVGMDAAAQRGFLSWREQHPGTTGGLALNSLWYSIFACINGGFCFDGNCPPVSRYMRLRVKEESGEWRNVEFGGDMRAVVFANIGNYAAGRNIWGPTTAERGSEWCCCSCWEREGDGEGATHRDHWKPAMVSDGLIEVCGLTSGWHAAMVMGYMSHGVRLAQAKEVIVELFSSETHQKAYLQVDGDAWAQNLPNSRSGEEPVRMHLAHEGCASVLHKKRYRINAPA